jgi:putative glycosyltransferase (TIGR04348 family)
VLLVTPAPLRSYQGNAITAHRWAHLLEELGHQVVVAPSYQGQPCDVLVALHARRSAESIRSFAEQQPGAPIIVALTGTDLYPDLSATGVDPDVLLLASRFVVLQHLGLEQLPPRLRQRGRMIVQSAEPSEAAAQPLRQPARGGAAQPLPLPCREGDFVVAILAHLRPVKDPLLAARASGLLPSSSKVAVLHLGAALDPNLAEEAEALGKDNPRYRWLGEVPRAEALRLMASSQVLAVTSKHEGGANVVSEAIASSVPVISSRIDGSIGLLGPDYPGYFEPGDAAGLAELLWRLERNQDGILDELRARCQALRSLVDPARERQAWTELLAEVVRR